MGQWLRDRSCNSNRGLNTFGLSSGRAGRKDSVKDRLNRAHSV